jgi:hypothetical protein
MLLLHPLLLLLLLLLLDVKINVAVKMLFLLHLLLDVKIMLLLSPIVLHPQQQLPPPQQLL